jgi:hypothetical protein
MIYAGLPDVIFSCLLVHSHVVIQTSQEIGDAPYGDHFIVEVRKPITMLAHLAWSHFSQ